MVTKENSCFPGKTRFFTILHENRTFEGFMKPTTVFWMNWVARRAWDMGSNVLKMWNLQALMQFLSISAPECRLYCNCSVKGLPPHMNQGPTWSLHEFLSSHRIPVQPWHPLGCGRCFMLFPATLWLFASTVKMEEARLTPAREQLCEWERSANLHVHTHIHLKHLAL